MKPSSAIVVFFGFYSGLIFAGSDPSVNEVVNGSIPPGTIARAAETMLINQEHPSGHVIVVIKTVRPKNTRTPIHQHPSSGTTCVISGEMTLYLEDAPPKTATAGACYEMPTGKKMAGVNSGNSDAVMLDIFFTPKGGQLWTVLEPQHKHLQDQLAPPNN
jgi:quercetin dioxygenase-like cupin family protein